MVSQETSRGWLSGVCFGGVVLNELLVNASRDIRVLEPSHSISHLSFLSSPLSAGGVTEEGKRHGQNENIKEIQRHVEGRRHRQT